MGDVPRNGCFLGDGAYYFFGMAFNIAIDPYRVANSHPALISGLAQFQLLSATPMSQLQPTAACHGKFVDDMKLGKIVKQSVVFVQERVLHRISSSCAGTRASANLVRGGDEKFSYARRGLQCGACVECRHGLCS